MKYLILAALLSGCAVGSFPTFPPTVKNHWLVEVRDEDQPPGLLKAITNRQDIPAITEVVRCLKFEIVEKIPYQIKFVAVVPLKECNGVGGYKPDDSVSIYNWMDDVAAWAETRKKCFK